MPGSPWSIRRATAEDSEFLASMLEDGEFLASMLVEAVNRSAEWKPRSRRRVLADPRTARYTAS